MTKEYLLYKLLYKITRNEFKKIQKTWSKELRDEFNKSRKILNNNMVPYINEARLFVDEFFDKASQ